VKTFRELIESSVTLKQKDMPKLKDFRDENYLAGEVSDYLKYKYFPTLDIKSKEIIKTSATPDRGGNHGKSGYYVFDTSENTYTLKISDFTNTKTTVKEVNDFFKKNLKNIKKEIKGLSIDFKFLEKVTGSRRIKDNIFAGRKTIEVDMRIVWADKYGFLDVAETYSESIKAEIRSIAQKMVDKIKKKYKDYNVYYGVGYKIVLEK